MSGISLVSTRKQLTAAKTAPLLLVRSTGSTRFMISNASSSSAASYLPNHHEQTDTTTSGENRQKQSCLSERVAVYHCCVPDNIQLVSRLNTRPTQVWSARDGSAEATKRYERATTELFIMHSRRHREEIFAPTLLRRTRTTSVRVLDESNPVVPTPA